MAATATTTAPRQTTNPEPRVNTTTRSAAESTLGNRHATDDEILGLVTPSFKRSVREASRGANSAQDAPDGDASDRNGDGKSRDNAQREFDFDLENITSNAASAEADRVSSPEIGSAVEPAHLRAAFDANPELRAAWQDASAYRQTFATPAEARAATALLADLNHMDALFFSRQPEDHAKLARTVAELDPVAFASLARAMTQVADTAGAGFPAIAARSAGNTAALRSGASVDASVGARQAVPGKDSWRDVAHSTPSPSSNGVTPGQEQFFHATNASAVEGVLEAIESQVERLLPEGISKSARNRVVGEIYRELDSTLRSNRALSQQMRQAFRSGALDADHQNAIVSLITNRARQALPGVAKRVLNEWTTTVISANQQRRERQRTAERRVDIAGSGGAANDGRHSMGPRDVDYARMSDADILNL